MTVKDPHSEISRGRLSRWSERKQIARSQRQDHANADTLDNENNEISNEISEEQTNTHLPAEGSELSEAVEIAEQTGEVEELVLTDDDMPSIESIDSQSDVSCFFNKGVSEQLRQKALHRLLHLPAFNITDGLNDYDEDYTSFEPLGDIVTSDMRFHAERKARLAAEEEAANLAEQEQLAADQDSESIETATSDAEQESDVTESDVTESDASEQVANAEQIDPTPEEHTNDIAGDATSLNVETNEDASESITATVLSAQSQQDLSRNQNADGEQSDSKPHDTHANKS